jgi:DNA-binding NarL/FixJ family response regulator
VDVSVRKGGDPIATSIAQRPVRVVIADDSEAFRLLMRTVLRFEPDVEVVGEAADGIEAVRLAERERADVCLVDVNMPLLDGTTVAEVLAALRPGTRTVLHTASPYGSAQARAVALGLPVHDKANFQQIVQELVRERATGDTGP